MHCHNYHPQMCGVCLCSTHNVLHSCFAVATRIQATDVLRRCGTLHELLTFTTTEWVLVLCTRADEGVMQAKEFHIEFGSIACC